MRLSHKVFRGLLTGFVVGLSFLIGMGLAMATTITWSHTFSDGEVLTANMLETLKTNITDVVNVGGGPVSLTSTQTVSGDKTLSGTTTISGTFTMSGGSISGANALIFEGTTADAFELTLAVPDPTADITYTLNGPAAVSGYIPVFANAGTVDVSLVFEGATADAFETTLTIVDPTADRTITFGNEDLDFREQKINGWCIFDGTAGTIACADSFNVTSLTDGGTGKYTVNWTTAQASANYPFTGTCRSHSANPTLGCTVTPDNTDALNTTTALFHTRNADATAIDSPEISIMAGGNR